MFTTTTIVRLATEGEEHNPLLPEWIEVILALGPSIDGTNELVAEMSAADPRIRAIDNPVGSTPAGLNVAIRASVHPVVIRVDAHSVLPTDYTRIAVHTLLESGADMAAHSDRERDGDVLEPAEPGGRPDDAVRQRLGQRDE